MTTKEPVIRLTVEGLKKRGRPKKYKTEEERLEAIRRQKKEYKERQKEIKNKDKNSDKTNDPDPK